MLALNARNPSGQRKLLVLLVYFPTVLMLVSLAYLGLQILSGERGYMVGESHWSKSQKAAVLSLYRYLESADEDHFIEFKRALIVPEADEVARHELEKSIPDLDLVRRKLIKGNNHPEDVDAMIMLFRRLRHVEFMERVADIWLEAKTPIDELRQLGEAIHVQMPGLAQSRDLRLPTLRKIDALDVRLTRLEHEFSAALNDGYRQTRQLLVYGFLLAAFFLLALGAVISKLLWRRIESISAELQRSEEHLRLAVSGSNDGTWDWDMVSGETYYSPRFKQLLAMPQDQGGYDRAALLEHMHPDDIESTSEAFRKHVRQDVPYDADFRLRGFDGKFHWLHSRGKAIRDASGRLVRMVGSVTDVSERKRLEAELESLAMQDALTGILNRHSFKDALGQALATEGALVNGKLVLIYLDLDQFKIVNDTCGHAAGDQLLCDVSVLLGQRIGENDVIARLGGDEFGVLVNGCTLKSAWEMAESMLNAIHGFQFVHEKRTFWLGVSIGVVILDPGLDTVDAVLAHADRACYLAKEEGRNRIRLYAHSDRDVLQRREEMDWVSRLRNAMAENRLCLYAQPIVALDPAEAGATHQELLLRLIDEDGELVPPMAFIPAAERYGLMPELDRWVIETAFARYAELTAAGHSQESGIWGINLSGLTLGDEDFPSFLQRCFLESGVPFAAICFEVTETAVVGNLRRAGRFIKLMKSMGCRFALDDFGAGASSFSYLKELPVDFIKIDASLVRDLLNNPVDDVMVDAIHRIARAMNIGTIAEGVEDGNMRQRLAEIGVNYAQGYGLGRPAPLESL